MEITWHGNQCFKVKGKRASVVINPGREAKGLKGNIVLNSTNAEVEADELAKVVDWPGEYEITDVPIVGFQAWTTGKSGEEGGEKGDQTIIFYFKVDGVKFCHLGSLGHVLTSEMINKIGDVDVLMIDAGSTSNLNSKKTLDVVEAIEPKALIPMGDGKFADLLKELGAAGTAAEDKVTLKSASELPTEKRSYLVLNQV